MNRIFVPLLQTGRIVALLVVLSVCLCMSVLAPAQEGQSTQKEEPKPLNISDLESYQDLPVKPDSKRDVWYKLSYDQQWIGWAQSTSSILQTFQEQGTKPVNIYKHYFFMQVSPHLVRDQLLKSIRKEVRSEHENTNIASRDLDKIVQKRVQSRFKELSEVLLRRSASTTIYLNKNRTFREGKFGFSSQRSESFTLYVKPKILGSGQFTVLTPGEVPKDLTLPEDAKIVNPPLAAREILMDQFSQDTYNFFVLGGTPSNPLIRTKAEVLDDEWSDLEIGDETYSTRNVRFTMNLPDANVQVERWWIDQKGIIRKVEQETQAEDDPPLVMTSSTRKEAKKGYTFVFARRGRRDPFKPVWPKERPDEVSKEDDVKEACKGFEPKKVLNEAKTIVFEKAPRSEELQNKSSRVKFQQSLTKSFNDLKTKVMECGEDQHKKRIQNYEKELRKVVNIAELMLSMAREQLRKAQTAFENRAFDRISVLDNAILKWHQQLPSDTPEEVKRKFADIIESVNKLKERARIRKSFLDNAPKIRGVLSSQEKKQRTLTLGFEVFGDRVSTEINVTTPKFNSVAIVEVPGSGEGHRARREGETLNIQGLGEATLERVHKHSVVFKYKGESIKVPLLKVTETLRGG